MARAGFSIPNGARAVEGAVAVPVSFDFTGGKTVVSSDLMLEQQTGAIAFVQSIFIDNRLNAQPFTITFSGMQYTIQVRGGRQGVWPVVAGIGALAFTALSNGGVVVPTIMMNNQQPYFFWDV